MIRPISIALVYGGKRSADYARVMRELILEKCEDMPTIPLLVDTDIENDSVWKNIESTFEGSDYAFVFVSEVYEALKITDPLKTVYMTTPNLMLEFGYLINLLGKSKIKIILDFEYERTNTDFVFPSDCHGDYKCSRPSLKDARSEEIKTILAEILNSDLDKLKRSYELSNIKDIRSGRLGIEGIFRREIEEGIESFSIDKQYSTVFKEWLIELFEFSRMNDIHSTVRNDYVLSYLYSRLLFFPAFHEVSIPDIRIMDLKVSNNKYEGILSISEARALNSIIDYIIGNKENTPNRFYYDAAKNLSRHEYRRYGLPDIIIKNYTGLGWLNYAKRLLSSDDTYQYYKTAYECFSEVINQSSSLFGGEITETCLRSFAYYNRARASCGMGNPREEWLSDFINAESSRTALSVRKEFPSFIRNYFKQEVYHCVNMMVFETINWYNCKGEKLPADLQKDFTEREQRILDELKLYEQTVVANQPFFGAVKKNTQKNISAIKSIMLE